MTRILLFFLDRSQLTASGGREKPDKKHVVFAAAKREAAWRDAAWCGQRPLPLKPVCPVRPQKWQPELSLIEIQLDHPLPLWRS